MLESAPDRAKSGEPSSMPHHRHVLTKTALLGATTVLVKLASLAKDWLVAYRLGAGDELDAFLVAFLVPAYAIVVLAHSFGSAFMPTYIRISERQGTVAASKLVNSALVAGLGLLVVSTLALVAAAPWMFAALGHGFDAPKQELTRHLFYLMAGAIVASGVTSVFGAALNAHENFAVTVAAPAAMPVIAALVFWSYTGRSAVYGLALGTLVGYVLESVIVTIAAVRAGYWRGPKLFSADADLRHVAWQYAPIALGSLLMSSSLVIDQSMAASLGSGNVSILNFGNKVVALVLNILAVNLSTVLFPRFSRMITAGRWDELKATVRSYSRMVFIASIPGVAFLALITEPLIRLVFERGAFTHETTIAVSQVQLCYLPQIPFAVLVMLGYRVLSALDGNPITLRIGVLNLVMNVGGNFVLMHYFGVKGLALSTSLMYFVAWIATFAAIKTRIAEVSGKAGS